MRHCTRQKRGSIAVAVCANNILRRVLRRAAKRYNPTHTDLLCKFKEYVIARKQGNAFQGVWLFAQRADGHGGWIFFNNTGDRGKCCKEDVMTVFANMTGIQEARDGACDVYRRALEVTSMREMRLSKDFSFGNDGNRYKLSSWDVPMLPKPPPWSEQCLCPRNP